MEKNLKIPQFSNKLKEIVKTQAPPLPSIPKDKYIVLFIQISLFFTFLSFGFFFFHLFTNSLPPQVPLYYSLSWGKNQLATKYELLILPTSSLLVFFINFALARFLYPTHILLARITLAFSSLFSFLSTISLYQIISLIT